MNYKKVGDNRWIIEVQENNETKELFLELPPDSLAQLGWVEGDDLEWHDNKDGSYTLTKKEKEK